MIDQYGFSDFVWLFEARLEQGKIPKEVIKSAWPKLDIINSAYYRYVKRWQIILARLVEIADQPTIRACMELSEYELTEIIYADPQLPDEFLPRDWGFNNALNLYKRIIAYGKSFFQPL